MSFIRVHLDASFLMFSLLRKIIWPILVQVIYIPKQAMRSLYTFRPMRIISDRTCPTQEIRYIPFRAAALFLMMPVLTAPIAKPPNTSLA